MEAILCFFLYVGTKFLVPVQNVLVLVAVTGENVGDEGLCIRHQKEILIWLPDNSVKKRSENLMSIVPAKPFIKLVCRKHDPLIEILYELADLAHVAAAIGAADKMTAGL